MGFFDIFSPELWKKLPIQGRVERWKNELDALEKEKNQLEQKGIKDEKTSARYGVVIDSIAKLNGLLKNKAE